MVFLFENAVSRFSCNCVSVQHEPKPFKKNKNKKKTAASFFFCFFFDLKKMDVQRRAQINVLRNVLIRDENRDQLVEDLNGLVHYIAGITATNNIDNIQVFS